MKGQGLYAPVGLITAASASATTDTFDCSAGNSYKTLARTADLALSVVNMQPGVFYSIEFLQDATGGRALTMPGLTFVGASFQIDTRPSASTVIVFGFLRPGFVVLLTASSSSTYQEAQGIETALITSPVATDLTISPGPAALSGASSVARKNILIDVGKVNPVGSRTTSITIRHADYGSIVDGWQVFGTSGTPDTNLSVVQAFQNTFVIQRILTTSGYHQFESLGSGDYIFTCTGAGSSVLVQGSAGTCFSITDACVITLGRVNTDVLKVVNKTQTTIGAAGGAAALPATPLGYVNININGTEVAIPYYNRV